MSGHTGGSAFPAFVHPESKDGQGMGGMTLRDYFAAQALTGIVGPNYDRFTSNDGSTSRTHEAAFFAYSLADAMLLARSKP